MRFTRNFLFGDLELSPVAALKRSHSFGSGSASRFSFFLWLGLDKRRRGKKEATA